MANWNNPTLTSLYVDFLTELKARDDDAIKQNPISNFPVGSRRTVGGPFINFQIWDGAIWNTHVVAVSSGGTGSDNATSARTNLGLGTMSIQNSNAVAITGGTMSGVNIDAGSINSGILALSRGGTGASLALGANGAFLQSNGSQIIFGTNGSVLTNLNASNISSGNIPMVNMPTGGEWTLSGGLPYVRINGGIGLIVGSGLSGFGEGIINARAYYINDVPFVPGSGVPSGAMLYFSGACPTGWTFVAGSGGRTVKSINGGVGTTGGSDTQAHGFSVPSGGGGPVNSGQPNNANSGVNTIPGFNAGMDSGSGVNAFLMNQGQQGSHAHTIAHDHDFTVPEFPGFNGATGAADNWPPWIEFTLCRKN